MSYEANDIIALEDIEHVRLRPSMYISTDHPSKQMFSEIFDNAMDEVLNDFANRVEIAINYEENSFTISDNGRGLPQGINDKTGKSAIELIYQSLNAGGKFDSHNYSVSSGLHGCGSCVVNALSKSLCVSTWRNYDGKIFNFVKGKMVKSGDFTLNSNTKSGTTVTVHIDTDLDLFKDDPLSKYKDEIEHSLKMIKTLIPNLTLIYNGEEIGVQNFSDFLPKNNNYLLEEPILLSYRGRKWKYTLAVNWDTTSNRANYNSYANIVHTPVGGDHVTAVRNAFSNVYGNNDIEMGMNLIVSVTYPGIQYDSQAKIKAISKEMKMDMTEMVTGNINRYFKDNPEIKDNVFRLIKEKRDILSRRNKAITKRDRKKEFLATLIGGGFVDCSTNDRSKAELYLCEGNSASGSLRQARDTIYHAVMPLRGKVINAYTSSVEQLLNNKEVQTIINALDCGIYEECDYTKCRYGRIIITTDADVDGGHICVLLISLFSKLFKPLVDHGMLYIALPPLYSITKKDGTWVPFNDEETKNKYIKEGYEISRYKGLGECNPDQLYKTCMSNETRTLLKVTTSDNCYKELSLIMGGDSQYRKKLLIEQGVLEV